MEETMRECLRKLALWHTRTFRPILTHDELEPIMSTLGFVGLPPSSSSSSWKEYAYSAQWRRRSHGRRHSDHHHHLPHQLPRPRLPYPRIDGLHSYTYQAFIDAVNFYLEMADISLLFHIRGMPLQRVDIYKKWKRMQEDDSVFVYREGTLDQSTYNLYHRPDSSNKLQQQQHPNNGASGNSSSLVLRRDRGATTTTGSPPDDCVVPLKDIIAA